MTRQELELWGGEECTVNRIKDVYIDQLALNGHRDREDDLARFAALGISAIRCPILWERTVTPKAPEGDWTWNDSRLSQCQGLGITPIVGLLHHGSGPLDTGLLCNDFPERLAAYAGQVARRYPWVDRYTPVNEPLTTARFSGLYGIWYPHQSSGKSFARALVNQCRAVVLAMEAIRAVNPAAQLVQTEDLAKVFSTPKLAYQARFENERRWLTFDLITGRLSPDHTMWRYLEQHGIHRNELAWFLTHALSDVILGCNYYVTSERLLDESIELYPPAVRGGNGRDQYADVEAVRARQEGLLGLEALLAEVWDRYRLPIALTEVHLGCHRESQIRWLLDAWQAAHQAQKAGADIRAVTVWSLLGSYDWDSLLTQQVGHYEPGVFDVRVNPPRETRLADVVRSLATRREFHHPAISETGWWQREQRLAYPPVRTDGAAPATSRRLHSPTSRARPPLLITGASGTLGRAFGRVCSDRHLTHVLLPHDELDITDTESIRAAVTRYRPWAIVNAAGYVRVDEAETDVDCCHRLNALGPALLAESIASEQIQFLTFSSDLVFDGKEDRPYVERDRTGPLSVYGASKRAAEQQVLSIDAQALIIRTSTFFGPWDEYNLLTTSLRALAAGQAVSAPNDWIVSPTYVPDLVHVCLDLLIDRAAGIWHVANEGTISWADFILQAATAQGIDRNRLRPCRGADLGLRATRPQFSALGSERRRFLPTVEEAIWRYCHEISRC